MDYTRNAGGAAIGARLRRLSEMVDGDTTRIYERLGIRFEQRWFGVLNQLALNGPATVSELASALRISHASVSQTRQSLERAGVVLAEPDASDARRRTLTLAPAGRRLVKQLRPLWQALERAALELNAESGDVTKALDRMDDALANVSMFDRILKCLPDRKLR